MPQISQGPNTPSHSEASYGGADAVPETPDAAVHGASLDSAGEAQLQRDIGGMRQWIARGRWWWALVIAVAFVAIAAWMWSALS